VSAGRKTPAVRRCQEEAKVLSVYGPARFAVKQAYRAV